jgi:hypothetical protein
MSNMILDQAGTGNSSMKLSVDYTDGNGYLTITALSGGRDNYSVTEDFGSSTKVYCKIAGETFELIPLALGEQGIRFGKNYAYATFWTGTTTKSGISGDVNIEFTFTSSHGNSNIDNSKFVKTLNIKKSPVITDVTVSNIGRTTADASFTVTDSGGAAISDTSIGCSLTNYGTEVSVITGTSGSFSGLTPNTTYYTRAFASNNYYDNTSNVGSFTTIGNAPTINSVTTTPALDSCEFDIDVSYDINDGFSSQTIEYGTTESYGSSVSTSEITGLDPNTKYYYKITITGTSGRTAVYTGNFTTLSAGGKVRYKVNGLWKEAKVYLKYGGVWRETVPYIKANGTWEKGE